MSGVKVFIPKWHTKTQEGVEPTPPKSEIKLPGHHWLKEYDSDGHFHGYVVLQWNPQVRRWSHSGNVATGLYVDTKHWRYLGPCPIPEG